MNTITMRVNDVELEEISRLREMASKEFKVSRHRIMKRAMLEGMKLLKEQMQITTVGPR
jgi:hypothetical protein